MPTVKEAANQRRRYQWFLRTLMEERERECRERLKELTRRQIELKPIYDRYLELYKIHIKPLQNDVDEFWDNLHEIRKAEHFLQGQDERRAKEEQSSRGEVALNHVKELKTYLPYAGKSQAGKKPPKNLTLQEAEIKEAMNKLKQMDPKDFAKLLKQVQED